ncbi:unnamed protein product [Clonostachys byssicola]|uniref:RED-like N-terminal domain-containing protein n=1 Tax=Clonostachys byssicola TaxID=160290 RepID=A0A9N9TZA1_9HYPO|nr:unnamed protein product [Clonostachys byssicola]
MNNQQFRKLLLSSSGKSSKDDSTKSKPAAGAGSSLGSRQRSSIPMTPRVLGGSQADFARQLADRNNANKPQRQFKTAAPRGSKLASGYVDRAKERTDQEGDDREERIKALEELLKKEEIDQETFDKMRFEIAGGDLESTHLVKGLDFKLLKRIKQGEDIYSGKAAEADKDAGEEENDIDDAFDELEQQDVVAVEKEKAEKKKGQLSTVSLAPGKKRTRDQILADLKAARAAAKASQAPALGDRFRKIGGKKEPGTRREIDSKGREVLIIVDADGHEKRKVRKLAPGQTAEQSDLLMPDTNATPLGMEVPEQYRKKEEEPEEDEDMDIFEGVGDDYDPLAGMEDSDSESDSEDDESKPKREKRTEAENEEAAEVRATSTEGEALPRPEANAKTDYFKGAKTALLSSESTKAPSMSDPAIMAAIKRAAAIKKSTADKEEGSDEEDDLEAEERKAREERRRQMLQVSNRDDEDLDMGFGTSRFEDEEDFGDSKVKLSAWDGDGGEGDGSRGGKSKRKRGPKKRKGDANSAADVLRVMEQRKKS